jgi:hypothetical protein
MASARIWLAALFVASALLSTANGLAPVYAKLYPSLCRAYTEHEKAMFVDIDILVRGLPGPSFTDLRQASFTLVGTYPKSGSASEWNAISSWNKAAKAAGLRTLLQAGPLPQPTIEAALNVAIDSTRKAASIGVDVVELDEFLSATQSWSTQFTQSQLLSIIRAGLQVNANLKFIFTEWSSEALNTAFLWTSGYQCVRVANDNYNNKGMIDLDVQLSNQYGRSPLTWLIFSQGSSNFDCYLNLNDWITYVKQAHVDALFFWVDPAGTWQKQVASALAF